MIEATRYCVTFNLPHMTALSQKKGGNATSFSPPPATDDTIKVARVRRSQIEYSVSMPANDHPKSPTISVYKCLQMVKTVFIFV
jgi:hypothetical protein